MEINHNFNFGVFEIRLTYDHAALTRALAPAITLLQTLITKDNAIMATLADIQAKVTAETTVETSVVTLLGELSSELKAAIASNDPVALQAIADQLDANTATLSAAVTANTPAAAAP